jgi:hypothetical protein
MLERVTLLVFYGSNEGILTMGQHRSGEYSQTSLYPGAVHYAHGIQSSCITNTGFGKIL